MSKAYQKIKNLKLYENYLCDLVARFDGRNVGNRCDINMELCKHNFINKCLVLHQYNIDGELT